MEENFECSTWNNLFLFYCFMMYKINIKNIKKL